MMNNAICKVCGAVIYDNAGVETEGVVYCTETKCGNSRFNSNEGDSMSWSDFRNKHSTYE